MSVVILDDADDKPLVIDQPEENLDPKSIYDDLLTAQRLKTGRRRRFSARAAGSGREQLPYREPE
jgi:hypothetical protein